MKMKRSLILTSTTPQGKKVQKTFTDVNENATAEAMLGATQRINLLTTNTYVQTDCVDKFNVDTEAPPADPRQTPTVTLDATPSAAAINSTDGQQIHVNYTGDGVWYVYIKGAGFYDLGLVTPSNAQKVFTLKKLTNDVPAGAIIGVIAEGTETYKPLTQEFEIQA